jgi:hypothetical protein
VIVSRSRRRGSTESLKINNFKNQVIHDQHQLDNKLDLNATAIASSLDTSLTNAGGTGIDDVRRLIMDMERCAIDILSNL